MRSWCRRRSSATPLPTTFAATRSNPNCARNDWAGAAVAAAEGLNSASAPGPGVSGFGVLVAVAILVVLVLLLWWWTRRRRRKRREAEFAAARRVDPSDPNALAAVPIDALDDLSKSIVVDVDNAVRTSDNELALAVEEFGDKDTAPFSKAVLDAKTTLAQAFNVRQILDDAVPETPAQRRDLLTRVLVAAAKADRELDSQREAFAQLRDLVINAPTPAGCDDPTDGRPDGAPGTIAAGAYRVAQPIRRYRTGFGGRQRRYGQAATDLRRAEHHQRAEPARPSGRSPGRARRCRPRGGVVAGPGAHAAGCGGHRRDRYQPRDRHPPRRRSPTFRTASRPRQTNWLGGTSRRPTSSAPQGMWRSGPSPTRRARAPLIRWVRSPS